MASRLAHRAVTDLADRYAADTVPSVAIERYARDPFAHLDDGHIKILDLVTLDEVEFRPWPHQREIVAAWIDLDLLAAEGLLRYRNVIEEKSRQEGATWILSWTELWALTYHDANGLVLHLDFSEVDDGGSGSTPESFFGKIRWMHGRMPDRYRAPLRFKYGMIQHDYLQRRVLTAEGAGPDPGRGGRYSRVIVDEAARIPFGEAAHSALSRACPTGRFYNSTPHGEDNVYARLAKKPPRGYVKLRHHWSTHPVYSRGVHVAGEEPDTCTLCFGNAGGARWNPTDPACHRYPGKQTSPWYDQAVLDLTDDQVAMELDIDYSGSLSARVYPEFDEGVHVSVSPIPYDPILPIEFCIDYGLDTSSVTFFQDVPYELRAIGEVEIHDNATPEAVSAEMLAVLAGLGIEHLDKRWTLRALGIGDPAGEARQQGTGRSLVTEYRLLGWNIRSRRFPIARTITATKRLLLGRPKPFIISEPDCPLLIEHLKNNRWPTDRQGNRKAGAPEPLNDRHNHACRALSYLVATKWPPRDEDAIIRDATAAIGGEADAALIEEIRARSSGGVGYDERF